MSVYGLGTGNAIAAATELAKRQIGKTAGSTTPRTTTPTGPVSAKPPATPTTTLTGTSESNAGAWVAGLLALGLVGAFLQFRKRTAA